VEGLTGAPLAARERELDRILDGLGSVLVAFSGGVDSAYLALRAHQRLGARSLAVTADSESLAVELREQALALARHFGFRHRLVRTAELANPHYARNAADRCYHCKTELFARLVPLAAAEGLAHVAYGLIVDDLSDFRPGQRAAREAGARTPLAEAGLTKDDVRALSRTRGLATWDQPASPCLASRLAYGTPVTAAALRRIEAAEAALRRLGFRELRVRQLGDRARVEIAPAELPRLADPALRARVVEGVRAVGYAEVAIDPEGYRRGRLNEVLTLAPLQSGI